MQVKRHRHPLPKVWAVRYLNVLSIAGFVRPAYTVAALCAVLIVAGWALTLERVDHEYRATLEDVSRRNDNLVLAYEQHTIRTLEFVDQAVRFVRYEYLEEGERLQLDRVFNNSWLDSPLILYAAIVDAKGKVIKSNRQLPGRLEVADRDYFKAHRSDARDELLIAAPTAARSDGRPSMHASRRITGPDGSFRGVALLGIAPERMADFQQLIDLGPSGVIQLVGMDGVARVRRHGGVTTFGDDMRSSQLLALAAQAPAGNFTTRGRVDGRARLQSYRRLADFPFVVGVGVSADEALAGHARQARMLYASAAGATLLIVLLGVALAWFYERQVRAADALRESEARFRSLTELSSDFYWETDAEHRLTQRGSAGKPSPVGAFARGFQLGKRRWEMPYLSPDESGWRAHRALLDARLPFRGFEISRRGDDGTERFISLSGDPVFDAAGAFLGYRGVGTDITEHKRAHKQLQESERRFRNMLGEVKLISLMLDRDACITYCNDYLLELTGWTREEVLGRDWLELFIPRDGGEMRAVFEDLLRDTRSAWHHENDILTRGGERRLVRWNNTVLRSISGEVIGTASIGEDITEVRRAEQAIAESARRAAAHAHAIGEVSASEALALGDVEALARLITERAAAATGVARANVWLFNEDASELRCIDLFEACRGQHSAGGLLYEAQFGNEFQALRCARYVNADDPLTDPRTAGYVESYLKPLGITSMLDAVVHISGRHLGLLCLEHVGPAHTWTEDEIAFACQLADKLALALTNRGRREAEARYRATFEQAGVGIAHATLEGRFLKANRKFCHLVDYSEEELRSLTFAAITHPDDRAATLEASARLRNSSDESFAPEYEKRYVRKDGSVVWAAVSVSLARDTRGAPDYFIAMVKDITARKQVEEKLEYQSHYDALTELPNRSLFYDRLGQALSQARRHDWHVGVLVVDVDRFRSVNDTLGHATGDRLLREVGARLLGCMRAGDTVARVGGDEFALIAADLAHPQDAGLVAGKMLEALARPFVIDGQEIFISGSIGIAAYPLDGRDAVALMKNADVAMSRAKELGRNNYQFYAAAMNARAMENLLLLNDLRRALERGEFRLHFQPKASLESGRVCGFEALLRWERPGHGLVPPGKFIPLLEESGLIVPVGEWVIRAACAQLRDWRAAGLEPLPVAVNLAAKQFAQRGIVAVVDAALLEHGVPPHLLEIEITESDAMQDAERVLVTLGELSTRGVGIAIDDFGTGYSSLSYLKRFPVQTLKLDRSFVNGLPSDANDVSIALAVITMAHSLGFKVVAEGVEKAAQRDFLALNGCDQMQGYLFAKPMPAAECVKLLAPAPVRAAGGAD